MRFSEFELVAMPWPTRLFYAVLSGLKVGAIGFVIGGIIALIWKWATS